MRVDWKVDFDLNFSLLHTIYLLTIHCQLENAIHACTESVLLLSVYTMLYTHVQQDATSFPHSVMNDNYCKMETILTKHKTMTAFISSIADLMFSIITQPTYILSTHVCMTLYNSRINFYYYSNMVTEAEESPCFGNDMSPFSVYFGSACWLRSSFNLMVSMRIILPVPT